MKQKQQQASQGLVRETAEGTEVRCPNCGNWARIEAYRSFTLNPHYVTELSPVLQCHGQTDKGDCMHIFSPIALAMQMRAKLLAGVEE